MSENEKKDTNVEEKVEVEEEKVEETKNVEMREDVLDEGKLPFPRATITNLVRKHVSKGKQIKGTVKDEMNLWVSKMIEGIAGKMNSQPYTFVNYDMLKEAIAPYEEIADIEKQKDELKKKISIITKECDSIINYIDTETKAKATTMKLEEDKLPFPKATITNKLRSSLDEGKTIKGPVKRGLNVWLGRVVARVSQKMDSYPYPYIDRSMFKDAIEPYEAIGEIELEKERIIQQMESIKTSVEILNMEIERKFNM
ncbi:MAG: hypothetical protein HON47_04085 [Candidatus Diapherotrites archaeon]|jgi:hypothetical protein|uniref:Uncharacterized protein n=1 Tax=Candidatus Iainarchaeum sp. TaxID=3101447 RepID=A0A8T5GG87_9ARCH|nr:hypothetical protein [Candidatus Diapherotrites archaeon]MBT7240883.1 hypothetical protein [Candidatus Diapherotrites archaeon]